MLVAQLDDHHADECAVAAKRTDNPHHPAMLKFIDRWRSDTLRQQATDPELFARTAANDNFIPQNVPPSGGPS